MRQRVGLTVVLGISAFVALGAPTVRNNLLIPTLTDENNFPASASRTMGAIMFGTDGGVPYWSLGDGGGWTANFCAPASATDGGCLTGGTQSIVGPKTFLDNFTIGGDVLSLTANSANVLFSMLPTNSSQLHNRLIGLYSSATPNLSALYAGIQMPETTAWFAHDAGVYLFSTRLGDGGVLPLFMGAINTTVSVQGEMVDPANATLELEPFTRRAKFGGIVVTDGGYTVGPGDAGAVEFVAVIRGNVTVPQVEEFGQAAMTANALVVTFNTRFNTAPVCWCNHINAVPIACGPTAAPAVTGATFAVASGGTDLLAWRCIGKR